MLGSFVYRLKSKDCAKSKVVVGPKIKIRCILHTAQMPYVRSYGSGGRGPGVRAAKFVNDLRFANDRGGRSLYYIEEEWNRGPTKV